MYESCGVLRHYNIIHQYIQFILNSSKKRFILLLIVFIQRCPPLPPKKGMPLPRGDQVLNTALTIHITQYIFMYLHNIVIVVQL